MAPFGKKLWFWIGFAGVLCLAALFVDPNKYLLGVLRGEAFFDQRPSSYWGRALASDDPKTQVESRRALKEGGREAVPVLVELLKDSATAWKAADILARIGPEAKAAIPALLGSAKDADPHVRSVARVALTEIGSLPPEAVPHLLEMLRTDSRLAALRALTELGPASRPAVPVLLDLLTDADAQVRAGAARTLGRIGPEAKDAVNPLIKLLKDADPVTREQAASALGRIGPAARPATENLLLCLTDKDYRVRRDAVRALGQLGVPMAALPEIRKLLADPDSRVREAARQTLKQPEDQKSEVGSQPGLISDL